MNIDNDDASSITSAAARGATPEGVSGGSNHGPQTHTKLGITRVASPFGPEGATPATLEDFKYSEGDYFANTRPSDDHGAGSSELRSGLASPVIPENGPHIDDEAKTELRAGLSQKSFFVSTELLKAKSLYFADLASEAAGDPKRVNVANLSIPFGWSDLDEFAMALFVRWIYGGPLAGPSDFHSMNHYLCLYVLAMKFDIEELKNTVMDLVRGYYHSRNMTAPAFRLEYVYGNTFEPCLMRHFLVTTAAYRALLGPEGLSDSMKAILRNGGDVAVEFDVCLVLLARNEMPDARKGDPCDWHEHTVTPKCPPWGGFEAYESA